VSAFNVRGFSQESDSNTIGAAIETEPIKMQSVRRNSATTEYKIVIDWTALVSPDNGNSIIIAYNL